MAFELARALLVSGAVTAESLAQALFACVTRGMPLARALVSVGAIAERRLEEELARLDVPTVRAVRPTVELMERLPPGLCLRLAAVPVRMDPISGKVIVAALDPSDPHTAEEMGYHLGAPVQIVRATLDTLRDALELYPGLRALAPPMGSPSRRAPSRPVTQRPTKTTPLYGTPVLEATTQRMQRTSDVPIPLSRKAPHVQLSPSEGELPTEPVFELRRGPPSGPATMRDAAPDFELRVPLPPKVPTAPNAPSPPFADPAAFLAGIREADDRDKIVGLVLLGVRTVARRVGILVMRRDGLFGWACSPELGDESAFRAVRIPVSTPSLLAALDGGVHLGPLLGAFAGPMLGVMKSATRDVAVVTVRVSGKPAVVILADELGDTLLGTKRMEELAQAAGQSLERILRARR